MLRNFQIPKQMKIHWATNWNPMANYHEKMVDLKKDLINVRDGAKFKNKLMGVMVYF